MVAAAPSWSIYVASATTRRLLYSFDSGASGSFSVAFRRGVRRRGFGFSSAGADAVGATSFSALWAVSVFGAAFLRGARFRIGFSSGTAAGEVTDDVASVDVSSGASVVFLRGARRRGFGFSDAWSVPSAAASAGAIRAAAY